MGGRAWSRAGVTTGLAAVFLSIAVGVVAAWEVQVSTAAFPARQIGLTVPAGGTSAAVGFAMEPCVTVGLTVAARRSDLSVTLVAPGGTRYTAGSPATTEFSSGIVPNDTPSGAPGAFYFLNLQAPVLGIWSLEVVAPTASSERMDCVGTVTYNGSTVRALLVSTAMTYRVGEPVRLALAVFDNTQRLPGLTVQAKLHRLNDPTFVSVPIDFSDDGLGPDDSSVFEIDPGEGGGGGSPPAADGLYHGECIPQSAGRYIVVGDVDHVVRGTTIHRTVTVQFDVISPSGQFGSQIGDRGIDRNENGLFEAIGVTPSLAITEAGTYVVAVRLLGDNGRAIQRSRTVTLPVGSATPEVEFAARDIVEELGVAGPYQVTFMQLSRVLTEGVSVQDVRHDGGSTAAYALAMLEYRPPLALTGVVTSAGVDSNGNGLYDWLDVFIGVYSQRALSDYLYTAELTDPAGAQIEVVNGRSMTLVAGEQLVRFRFSGESIGRHGVNGPYDVRRIVLTAAQPGPPGLSVARAGQTGYYAASEFEGSGTGDETPPQLSISLAPPGATSVSHELVEVTPDILVIDNVDPSPIVRLESITSNEGENLVGDGNTSPDIVVDVDGRIWLRAERTGTGVGRTYTLTFSARDHAGNVTIAGIPWRVPHDSGEPHRPPKVLASVELVRNEEPRVWSLRWVAASDLQTVNVAFDALNSEGDPTALGTGTGRAGELLVTAPAYVVPIVSVTAVNADTLVDSTGIPAPPSNADLIRPGTIADLGAACDPATQGYWNLSWTATADDSNLASSGAAAAYSIRVSSTGITEANCEQATEIGGPLPNAPGSSETWSVSVLSRTYVRIKARDEAGNWSGLSNQLVLNPVYDCGGEGLFAGGDSGGGGEYGSGRSAGAASVVGRGGGSAGGVDESSVLGGTPVGTRGVDVIAIPANAAGGHVYVRLPEHRGAEVDAVRLLVVDHAADVEVFTAGLRVLAGQRNYASRAWLEEQGDVTALVNGSGGALNADSGLVVLVETALDGTLTPVVIDAGPGTGPVGPLMLEVSNINGDWRPVGSIHPRHRMASFAIDSVPAGRLRLRFRGHAQVRSVGRLMQSTPEPEVSWASLQTASSRSTGDCVTAISTTDTSSVLLSGPDTLHVNFSVPPSSGDVVRSTFLVVGATRLAGSLSLPTRMGRADGRLPTNFALRQNQPNPFNNTTAIEFDLPRAAVVRLEVFDSQGRRVRQLVNRTVQAGSHRVDWDRRNGRGALVGPGIYFYRMQAGDFRHQKRMVVLP